MKLKLVTRRMAQLAVVMPGILAGCSSLQRIDATVNRAQQSADQARADLAKAATTPEARPSVQFTKEVWVNTRPIPLVKKEGRTVLDESTTFFSPTGQMELMEFAKWVTDKSGLPVRITPDAQAMLAGTLGGGESEDAKAIQNRPQNTLPRMPNQQGGNAQTPSSSSASSNNIDVTKWVNKPLRGLLDVVTVRLGLNWRKDDRGITIYYLDTQTFPFWGMATTTSTESVVSSGSSSTSGTSTAGTSGSSSSTSSSSNGGTATSTQNTSVTTKIAIDQDVEKSVKVMLTPKVGHMAMSASTGSITVTDTPEVLAKVGAFIAAENKRITRQVRINVQVLSVNLTDKDSVGIDWGLVYSSLSKNYGFGLSTSLGSSVTGMSGTFKLSSTSTSKFAGSEAVFKALAEQGRVATLTSPSVVTMNMRAVPVQFSRQTTYYGGKQSTTTGTSGTTTQSDIIGVATSGFNMRVLPVLMSGDDLQVQFDVNMSALDQLRAIANGAEAPEIDTRVVSQAVKLKSGQTLIVSGFEQQIDQGNKSGVAHPDNVLFGLHSTNNKDDRIVMTITPVLED